MRVVKHVQLSYSSLCYKKKKKSRLYWKVLRVACNEMNDTPVGQRNHPGSRAELFVARVSQEDLLIKTKLGTWDTFTSF